MRKKIIAMLLAGGQGSRLYDLTKNDSKPSVSYGGNYKIIDFVLSNCLHSGIHTVGVLTQYEPLNLIKHLGNGSSWDLDIDDDGLTILSPYQDRNANKFYKGTAHAIHENLNFVNIHNPEHVLILSGDHIYKMNYNWMLEQHIETNADITISVLNVPIEEASRFGIMQTDKDGRIIEFFEKPEKPISTLASMGVYIFKKEILEQYLVEDANDPNSNNDFGQNIIPKMLNDKRNVFAYEYKGYWKDVGTIQSLWEANMDLLDENSDIKINDPGWNIYTKSTIDEVPFFGNESVVSNALISEGTDIYGTVKDSIISKRCKINKNVVIDNSVILPNAIIGENTKLKYVLTTPDLIIPEDVEISGTREEVILLSPSYLNKVLGGYDD